MQEESRASVGSVLCFILVLGISSHGGAWELATNSEDNQHGDGGALTYLDPKSPTLVQPIESTENVRDSKFVQVEIVEIKNPRRYAATFKVEYQTKANERIFLGSFSLYPSDHPGKFIVATLGKLRNEGSIVLSVIIPDDFRSGDVLRAGVGKIKFLKS